MSELSLPLPNDAGDEPATGAVHKRGGGEVRWEVVARMPGLAAATIVASRLELEDIPVRVWQEAAGQALGLLVGSLGTGYVAVPAPYAERALAILDSPPPPVEYNMEGGE